MFKLFGFHPLPYRIAIFVLLCGEYLALLLPGAPLTALARSRGLCGAG